MSQTASSTEIRPFVLACLVEEIPDWPFGEDEAASELFLDLTEEMEVQPILLSRLRTSQAEPTWPEDVVAEFREADMARFAGFELRMSEVKRVVQALAQEGVDGIWLKGIPFAFTLYEVPHHRPSSDVDILVDREALPVIERIMTKLGYTPTPDLLFGTISQQKQFCRFGRRGLEHIFEFHLRTNNRPLLAPFEFRELLKQSISVPVGEISIRVAPLPESFLMAVVHLMGHLENDRRFLWFYDLKLMAQSMTKADWERVKGLASRYQCCALIEHALKSVGELTTTHAVPEEILTWLHDASRGAQEASAYYLRPDRNRRTDLWMGLRTLPTWSERIRTVALLAFPRPSYLRATADKNSNRSLFWLYGRRFLNLLRRR